MLVRSQNMPDLRMSEERIIDIQDRTAGISENCINTLLFQAFDDNISTAEHHFDLFPPKVLM